ncbi:late competence protein ComER [Halobacillus litoralis]|uniref:late competence protein ComER n=1 Tax=Halobacillus litoralis TaxID=45668 RepID=UPI001CD6DA7A|nr:late competence protein ComER [Halobacillus litoralis]MCA0970014.1 late competence protein ComER [Halobacillus litoralis]
MKWGIIGTGNMGSMLASSLIRSGAVPEGDLTLYNRSVEKLTPLVEQFREVDVSDDLTSLADKCDVLFLCVKPHDYKNVLKQLDGHLRADHCFVSITSPVSVDELEDTIPSQVARIVPSITNHALAGVSLFTFGSRVNKTYKQTLEEAFGEFSTPVFVEEPHIRVSSDIVSCGPAFISFLLKEWIEAAHKVAGIPEEKATKLTEQMVVGLGELFSQKIFTLEELMEKVTVKGGVTGEGLQALEDHTGELFEEMFKATQRKHKDDKESIELT